MQQRSEIDNKRKRERREDYGIPTLRYGSTEHSVHSNTAHREEPNRSVASVPCTGIGPPTIH
jgi:hypothetical protein